ncbi:hypothetical protein [Cytobacillus sp.]|uniref:hypothetical protein n=2 Tax=Bacillaceae TaxID=186817 RepID=UPI003514D722
MPENELIELYFKSDSQYMATVLSLISAMKRTAKKIKNYEKSAIQEMMRKRKNQQNYNAMLVPFLSVSYFHYDDFASYMKISSKISSSCTSCGGGGD